MPQVSKRCKAAFLRPQDIDNEDVVEVLGVEVQLKEDTKFQKSDRTILTVKHDGDTYRWGINNITSDRLVDAFGADSSRWVGKNVQVDKQRMNVSGKDRDVLFGVPLVQKDFQPAEK